MGRIQATYIRGYCIPSEKMAIHPQKVAISKGLWYRQIGSLPQVVRLKILKIFELPKLLFFGDGNPHIW